MIVDSSAEARFGEVEESTKVFHWVPLSTMSLIDVSQPIQANSERGGARLTSETSAGRSSRQR